MRKVASIILLLMLLTCLLISGTQTITQAPTKTDWAFLLMPDGSVVEGMCEHYDFTSNGTVHITIDGLTFHCVRLRVVVFEVEN